MRLRILPATIMLAMSLLYSGMANAASGRIGFCYGKISGTGLSKTGNGRISAATIIPHGELKFYAGATIKAIRVGLVETSGMTEVEAWVRDGLDGATLCSAPIAAPVAGWNAAATADKATIPANGDLAVGFSFNQKSSVKCISVAGIDTDDGYWVAKDGEWQNRSASETGTLSVELEIEGGMVPAYNVRIISAKAESPVVKSGDSLHIICVARNTALKPATGIDYTYDIGELAKGACRHDAALQYGETDTVAFDLPTGGFPADRCLELKISSTTPGDEYAEDDSTSIGIATYTSSMERKSLLEEFTSEYCANCPRAIQAIAACMDDGYDRHVNLVTYHVGYRDDWLTVGEEKAYTWLYGTDGTFAPAGMLDRTQSGKYGSDYPVFNIAYSNTLKPMLDAALSVPAFCSVTPAISGFDESTRTLSIQVKVDKMPQIDVLCKQPRITVVAIEDSIPAHDQAGIDSQSFRHRHVFRKSLTGIWGDPIAWNEDHWEGVFSMEVPESWNESKIGIIAFVSNYDDTNRNNCKIANSGMCMMDASAATGIANTDNGKAAKEIYYNTLDGAKVTTPQKGICIETIVFRDGSRQVKKILR